MGTEVTQIINILNVSKQYKSAGHNIIALKEISLNVKIGQSLLITGESGSGKTTLLKLIGLLDRPTTGKITIKNADTINMKERDRAEFRRKNIGFVFQKYHLLSRLSALENVSLPSILDGNSKKDSIAKAETLLNDLGLSDKKNENVSVLSGGESQRVAIARAISLDPEIILADEPTGNLDKQTEENILNYLIDFQKKNKSTLVLVSHNKDIISKVDTHLSLS